MITVRLEIKGKVQGVFFRATSRKIAGKNNVKGWIKNAKNGNVEAIITGKKGDVDMFIKWCREGPEKAIVDEVIITHMEETIFEEFDVKR